MFSHALKYNAVVSMFFNVADVEFSCKVLNTTGHFVNYVSFEALSHFMQLHQGQA